MNYTDPRSKLAGRKAHAGERRRVNLLSPRLLLAAAGAVLVAGYLVYGQLGGQNVAGGGPGAGGRGGFGGGFGGRGQAPPPVQIGTVTSRDIPILTNTIGNVLANATVAVKSQIEGPLLSASFREGQLVKRGDILFQIDPRPMEAALRQAEAQLARDRAQLASAQSDAERASMLAERGIVSTQQRDQIIATAKALTATEAANQAALERAQLNLSYTTIRAPIDGKTGPLLVHPGNLVRANDANGLVVINQVQPVKITFALPQNQLPLLQDRIREGTLVASLAVHTDSLTPAMSKNEDDLAVKVDFIGNVVDERSGTIELRGTHDNSNMRLVPGELVDVSVRLDTMRDAITVPRSAVVIGQDGGTYIWVLNAADEAQMRPVKMQFQDEAIAGVGDVVKVGERVVTDGQLRLTPGVAVSIIDPNAPRPAAAPQGGRGPGGGAGRGAGRGAGGGRRGAGQ